MERGAADSDRPVLDSIGRPALAHQGAIIDDKVGKIENTVKDTNGSDNDSQEQSDDNTTLAALGLVGMIGNPRERKDRQQKRVQPKKIGAPTTKGSKTAARQSNRQKKATFKMEQLRNKGMNNNGDRAY